MVDTTVMNSSCTVDMNMRFTSTFLYNCRMCYELKFTTDTDAKLHLTISLLVYCRSGSRVFQFWSDDKVMFECNVKLFRCVISVVQVMKWNTMIKRFKLLQSVFVTFQLILSRNKIHTSLCKWNYIGKFEGDFLPTEIVFRYIRHNINRLSFD